MAYDDWDCMRQYRAEKQKEKIVKCEKVKRIIKAVCYRCNLNYKEIQSHIVNVKLFDKSVNIYPKSNKYHIVGTGERGSFDFVGDFLEDFFNLPKYNKS